jgi:hypothetical protein
MKGVASQAVNIDAAGVECKDDDDDDYDDDSHYKPIGDDEFHARVAAASPQRMKVDQYERNPDMVSDAMCVYIFMFQFALTYLSNRTGGQSRSNNLKRQWGNVTRTLSSLLPRV